MIIFSKMVMCNGIFIFIEYDKRISGLSNALAVLEHKSNSDHRDITE